MADYSFIGRYCTGRIIPHVQVVKITRNPLGKITVSHAQFYVISNLLKFAANSYSATFLRNVILMQNLFISDKKECEIKYRYISGVKIGKNMIVCTVLKIRIGLINTIK